MSTPLQMPAVLSDESPPPQRIKTLLRWLPWLLTLLVLIGIAIAWSIIREPMQPLTPEGLVAARQKWHDAHIQDYDMKLQISGTAGRVDVQVREDKVVDLHVNGEPASTGEPHSYTVDGLFDILERESEMSRDPSSPLAGQGKAIVRVHFDEKYGLPRRYLRVIGGTNRSNEMKVMQFTPKAPSDPRP